MSTSVALSSYSLFEPGPNSAGPRCPQAHPVPFLALLQVQEFAESLCHQLRASEASLADLLISVRLSIPRSLPDPAVVVAASACARATAIAAVQQAVAQLGTLQLAG